MNRFCYAVAPMAFLLAAPAAHAAGIPQPSLPVAGSDWTYATGSMGNSRYSALKQITVGNVARLGAAWVSAPFDDGGSSRVTPLVQDGILYVTAGAKVYAYDAARGTLIWKYETVGAQLSLNTMSIAMGFDRTPGKGAPNVQGPGLGDGKLFIGLSDGHILALDAKSGKSVWDRDISDSPRNARAGVSAAPVYVNGVLYTSITFDEGRYVGRALALDARTGKELWRWNSIPAEGEPGHETWGSDKASAGPNVWRMGGANVWLPPIVDEQLGLVFYPTGNPSPNRVGGQRPGNDLYSSSVVALDIKTGQLRWYFQTTHHDLWENDLAEPLVAFDVEVAGSVHRGLGAMRPDGTLFLLDRANGKPLYPIEERAVPQNPLHATSPTQPFPLGKGSVIQRDCSVWKDLPEGFELKCNAYQPPQEFGTQYLIPGPLTRSSQMSYSPESGLFYVQGNDRLQWEWGSDTPYTWDFPDIYATSRVPYQDRHSALVLAAVDPKTYTVVWRKEYRMPANNYGVGGFLSTAGGLAFHRLEDGNLVAFNARTGQQLWQFQTGSIANTTATPMSYAVHGQQYIAVVQGNEVWAFRLGGTLAQRSAPELPAFDDTFRFGQIEDTKLITLATPNSFGYRHAIAPLRSRVNVGEPVNFVNNGAQQYTIVAMDGSWTTGPLLPREAIALTFDHPGRYLFHSKEVPYSYGELWVTAATTQSNAEPAASSNASFEAQASSGQKSYSDNCASCHGATLAGADPAPALAGSGFLSKYRGASAKTLFDRTRTTMPQGAPNSLATDQYWNIVAYLLKANAIAPSGTAALSASNAASVTLAARN